MRKAAALFMVVMLCAVISAAFAGCGGGASTSSAAASSSTAAASSSTAATGSSASASTAASSASSSSNSAINIDGVDVKKIAVEMVGDTPNLQITFSNTTDQDIEVDLSKFQVKVDDADEVNFHLTTKTVSANTPYSQNAFAASANTMKVGDEAYIYYDGELLGKYEVGEF